MVSIARGAAATTDIARSVGVHADACSAVRVRARDGAIDTMRGFAILMVIAIHALAGADKTDMMVIDSIFRPCVPVFLFTAGLLSARMPHIPLMRRLLRALVPYTIAFMAAYLFMAVDNPAFDQRPLITLARYGFAYVFVYYYVFVYVGCTLALWLLFIAAGRDKQLRQQNMILFCALAIVIGLAAGAYLDPLLQRHGVSSGFVEEVRMRDIPFWFAFVALGVIVGMSDAQAPLQRLRWPLAALTVVAYAAYAAIRVTHIGDAADYDSMAFFLYSALFCLTMLGFAFEWPALAFLGSASYFIYLWHYFIIQLLRHWQGLQHFTATAIVTEFAAALVVSAALAALIRRSGAPRLAQWLGA